MMTALFACRHQKKHLSVGEEFCEPGMATINYVTATSELTIFYNGQNGYFLFQEGYLQVKQIFPAPGEPDRTIISMHPDPLIFGDAMLTYAGVNECVMKIMDKLPGLNITLSDVAG